jgi:hypothetical protein
MTRRIVALRDSRVLDRLTQHAAQQIRDSMRRDRPQ